MFLQLTRARKSEIGGWNLDFNHYDMEMVPRPSFYCGNSVLPLFMTRASYPTPRYLRVWCIHYVLAGAYAPLPYGPMTCLGLRRAKVLPFGTRGILGDV